MTRIRSSGSGTAWTDTGCSCSGSRRSRTRTSSPSPPGSTASFTARPGAACSRRAASATRRSPTSRTSARAERSSKPRTAGACTASPTASGTPTRHSRTRGAATPCSPPWWSRRSRPIPSSRTCATAYDTLPEGTRASLEGLEVHHSIAYSRQTLGFEFSEEERDRLKGAVHPLVLANPRNGRRSLYLASHASRIVGRPVPGRAAAPARPHGPCHAAGARVSALVANRRLRHLGQPRDHAPGSAVRRLGPPARDAPRHHPRRGRSGEGRAARVGADPLPADWPATAPRGRSRASSQAFRKRIRTVRQIPPECLSIARAIRRAS